MTKISADDPIAQSANPIVAKVDQLRQLFPNAVTEAGQIDFEVLKELLSEYSEADQDEYGLKERYQFTWAGKSMARREASKTSTATLRPDPKESKDWDKTQNIFIEGDNLEVLKLLQKSYNDKVKLIYIDPPYNTGNDFVYPDDYKDNLKNYLAMTGQLGADGKKFNSNTEAGGRYHSNWLNMMYPRLVLARELLTEDGVIFISIDDNELYNLKKICDEIFGEENFRNTLTVRRRIKSLNVQFAENGLKTLNLGFEYILIYSKTPIFAMQATHVKKKNYISKGTWNVFWSGADRPTMRYELLGFIPDEGQWRWSIEKALIGVKNYEDYLENQSQNMTLEEYWESTGCELRFIRKIENGTGKNGGVQYWIPPSETSLRTTNFTDIEVSEIHKEIDLGFSNPKNIELILELFKLTRSSQDAIILDIFAGSGTTAHAVMKLNEDGGNRKFICIQLPEPTPEDSKSLKVGFKTISAITRERIRRAGDKIAAELKAQADKAGGLFQDGQLQPLDTGFRAYKLDSTNVIPWDSDPAMFSADTLFNDVIKQDRSDEDLMVELSLKLGLQLITKNETRKVGTVAVHCINNGLVFFALSGKSSPGLAEEVSKTIASWWADLKPLNSTVVLRDSLFDTDQEKLNALLTITAESNELNPIKVLTI